MLRLLLVAPLVALLGHHNVPVAEPPPVQSGQVVQTELDDWLQGTLQGVYVEGGDLRLQQGQTSGMYESPPFQTPFGLNGAVLEWHAIATTGQTLTLELRSSVDGQTWEAWQPALARSGGGGSLLSQLFVLPPFSSWVQYRAHFGSADASPLLSDVTLTYLNTVAGPALVDIVRRVPPPGPVALTTPPEAVAAEDWGALASAGQAEPQDPRRIVLSQLLVPADDPNSAATVRALQWVAVNLLGEERLPYHFLVDGAGTILQVGSRVNARLPGANPRSVAIGLLSDVEAEGLSEAAQASLAELLAWVGDTEGIPPSGLEMAPDAPPSLRDLLPELRAGMDRATVRSRLYFVAGDTAAGIEHISLLNRGAQEARAVLTALSGATEDRRSVVVPAGQRIDLSINTVFPLSGTVAVEIQSDRVLEAERVHIQGHEIGGGAALTRPERTWFLADGSGQDGGVSGLAILNPHPRSVLARLTLLPDQGDTVTRTLSLAPRSRQTISLPELAPARSFGVKLVAAEPILAERKVRTTTGALTITPASSRLSRRWLFAEGSTTTGSSTILQFLNPLAHEVAVSVRVFSEDGTSLVRQYAVGAERQLIVDLDSLVPALPFSIEVLADRPIVAERYLVVDGGQSAMAGTGATEPATRWVFVEGSTALPAEEYLVVLNPHGQPVEVDVRFLLAHQQEEQRQYRVGATARLAIPVNAAVPDQPIVSAVVTADRPVVVERTIYVSGESRRGAETSLGIPGE